MANSRWQIADGKWQMANDERRTTNDGIPKQMGTMYALRNTHYEIRITKSRITHHGDQPLSNLTDITHLVIDMDGVLYRGNDPVHGLSEFIGFLHAADPVQDGHEQLGPDADAVRRQARQARRHGRAGRSSPRARRRLSSWRSSSRAARVHVFGENSLRDAMLEQGFVLADEDVAAVVASIDWGVTFERINARLPPDPGAAPVSTRPTSIRRGRPRKGWCPAPAP